MAIVSRAECLETLRQRIARLEQSARPRGHPAVSSGCPALDNLLPHKGFCRGSLVEWLSEAAGAGAGTFALLAAREASRQGGQVVVFDRRREFFPPAAVRLGIPPEQLLVLRTHQAADHDWAMDQVLRCPAVAAVLAWPDRVPTPTFRRWQLAAEEGGCLGMLLRPAHVEGTPSWADVRLMVEPRAGTHRHRLFRVTVLHGRGGTAGRGVEVECNDETHLVYPSDQRIGPAVDRALHAV